MTDSSPAHFGSSRMSTREPPFGIYDPATTPAPVREPWQFSLSGLLKAIAALSLLFAVVYYLALGVTSARNAAKRSENNGRIFYVSLHLVLYDDDQGALPPPQVLDSKTGQPLHSWRYLLSPYLGYGDAVRLDVPWDDAKLARQRSSDVHRCFTLRDERREPLNTRIVAITGPGTAWGDGTTPPMSLKDIDADTILIVETRNSGLHWMEPGDFDIRTMPRTICAADGTGICGEFPDGFHIGLARGRVRYLPRTVPFELLEKFFTVEGARQWDLDEELEKLGIASW
jgi:hypothetical protein